MGTVRISVHSRELGTVTAETEFDDDVLAVRTGDGRLVSRTPTHEQISASMEFALADANAKINGAYGTRE